jgi:predicted RND superfamily exporter protein
MPPLSERAGLDNRRSNSLLYCYSAALTSAIAIGLSSSTPALRTILIVLGTVAAAVAVLFLSRFLQSSDERERQINYRALTLSFCGTLIFSLVVGLFQSAGFHSISWLGIPILMLFLILWSIGLIVYSWRYR